jgi:hypothetical protein
VLRTEVTMTRVTVTLLLGVLLAGRVMDLKGRQPK